jgi:hypothetical protein
VRDGPEAIRDSPARRSLGAALGVAISMGGDRTRRFVPLTLAAEDLSHRLAA